MAKKVSDTELIAALLSSPTRASAAKLLGITERTVYNRLRDADFARAFETAKAERAERLGELMDTAVVAALERSIKILQADAGGSWALMNDVDTATQVSVIRAVLGAGVGATVRRRPQAM